MVFPRTVLPVRVRLALGGQPAADPATWVWKDITQWVRVASGININFGQPDEGAKSDPGKCTLTLDNRDGRFSTKNIKGAWYGRIAKGTPIRVGTISVADTFGRTTSNTWGDATSGQTWLPLIAGSPWSTNGTSGLVTHNAAGVAAWNVLDEPAGADVSVTYKASINAVTTGNTWASGVGIRYTDVDNTYRVFTEFRPGGTVSVKIERRAAAVTTSLAENLATGVTYTTGTVINTEIEADGPNLRARIWRDVDPKPTTWHVTAVDSTLTGAGLGFYQWRLAGNTNAGALTVTIDDLEVEAIEFVGAVYDWPPRWDKSRKDATTTITGSGILRRLQQGKSALLPPIPRMLLRYNPVALWTLGDDSGSTVSAAAIPGVQPGTLREVELAQDTPPLLGAKQTAGINPSSVLTGRIPAHASTGTWGHVWFAYLPAPPAANTRIMQVSATGTVRLWAMELDSSGIWLRGWDVDGVLQIEAATGYAADITLPRWLAFDILVKQVGGTVSATGIVYGVNGDPSTPVMWVIGPDTVAGTIGSPQTWRSDGSLGFDGGRLAMVTTFNSEPPFVTYAFANAADGYVQETAADRIKRLCDEEGVQVAIEPGTSVRCGPQRTDTFLNLLYAAETADLGILYERGGGLGYRPIGGRYSRPVEFALDFDADDIAEAPEPVDDDQQLRNQWTITRDGGSSAVALDQASIDESGLLDEALTVNVATDGMLPHQANFRLMQTTLDEYRWPSIVLNLAANPQQIPMWRAAKAFPRMTIANEPGQVAGNVVDLTARGYSMELGPFEWRIELNCGPSSPWLPGVYGTSRYGSTSTTTNSTLTAVTGAGQSLTVKFVTPKDAWSATSVPYEIKVNGEVMTVTAAGAVSGTAPNLAQTLTVNRSGDVIAHAVGERVQIHPVAKYAL